jgi:hypothetical protein
MVLIPDKFMNSLQCFVDMLDANAMPGAIQSQETAPVSRFFAGLLHFADFRLDLAGYLFAEALDFECRIVRYSAHLLPDTALYFVDLP